MSRPHSSPERGGGPCDAWWRRPTPPPSPSRPPSTTTLRVAVPLPVPGRIKEIPMNSAADPIVILSYARTPMGSFQGSLAGASATELGAAAVGAAVERAGIPHDAIEKIYMGCVLPAGLGQAPARQAALKAGLPRHIEATTGNKMCGSGMQAAIMAADTIAAGSADIIVAGGMESMTNAPYLMTKHRAGARIGHDKIIDHMFFDGLE